MAKRLGKAERQLRREQWGKFREVRAQVVRDNVASMPDNQSRRVAGVPYKMLAGRSCQIEPTNLFLHSHTKGAYAPGIGQGSGPAKAKASVPKRFEPNFWHKDYGRKLNTKDTADETIEVWQGERRIK